jgi:hypothetical protein
VVNVGNPGVTPTSTKTMAASILCSHAERTLASMG